MKYIKSPLNVTEKTFHKKEYDPPGTLFSERTVEDADGAHVAIIEKHRDGKIIFMFDNEIMYTVEQVAEIMGSAYVHPCEQK